MSLTIRITLTAVFMLLLLIACAKETPPMKADAAGSPEAVYREFMLANLEGAKGRIRPLIVEQAGVEVLWQGAYPPDVATTLAARYRTMEISRVAEAPQRGTLKSTAAPTTLDVVFDGKVGSTRHPSSSSERRPARQAGDRQPQNQKAGSEEFPPRIRPH